MPSSVATRNSRCDQTSHRSSVAEVVPAPAQRPVETLDCPLERQRRVAEAAPIGGGPWLVLARELTSRARRPRRAKAEAATAPEHAVDSQPVEAAATCWVEPGTRHERAWPVLSGGGSPGASWRVSGRCCFPRTAGAWL